MFIHHTPREHNLITGAIYHTGGGGERAALKGSKSYCIYVSSHSPALRAAREAGKCSLFFFLKQEPINQA